ncbi:DUF2742 domain-containing protein [Mycolicibacterium mengxianglii]|uniref:DUF2742 domain-containing protein n=1 Tax=Mycolicibacterium mengxianglii TaxID=2736649 RepID=UPI0018EECFCE|nr:DUF2742 domain-containing protein [Mycolicibacterium mengxianglii]
MSVSPCNSQQVSFYEVTKFVDEQLSRSRENASWPMVGSPAWAVLDDYDPAKWAAILDAARHWALRLEANQTAWCDASRAVAAANDWGGTASSVHRREQFHASKPWMRREVVR